MELIAYHNATRKIVAAECRAKVNRSTQLPTCHR